MLTGDIPRGMFKMPSQKFQSIDPRFDSIVRRALEHAPARIRRLLPGVLVDAVALADEGWRTATLSRGTLGTLMRIHTSGDTAQRMSGAGIAEAARVMARAATALARAG